MSLNGLDVAHGKSREIHCILIQFKVFPKGLHAVFLVFQTHTAYSHEQNPIEETIRCYTQSQ